MAKTTHSGRAAAQLPGGPRLLADTIPELADYFDGPGTAGGEFAFDKVRAWSGRPYWWKCPRHVGQRWTARPGNLMRQRKEMRHGDGKDASFRPWLTRCAQCLAERGKVAEEFPQLARYARFDPKATTASEARRHKVDWECPHCANMFSATLLHVLGTHRLGEQLPTDSLERLVAVCPRCSSRTVADYPLLARQFVRLSQTYVADPRMVSISGSRLFDLGHMVAEGTLTSLQADAISARQKATLAQYRGSAKPVLEELVAEGVLNVELARLVAWRGAAPCRRSDTLWRCDACGEQFELAVLSAVDIAKRFTQTSRGVLHRKCRRAAVGVTVPTRVN